MVDRFFTSGHDIQVLLSWITEIRNDLLGMNETSESANQKSINLFADTKLKTFNFYAQSQNEKFKQDGYIKTIQQVGKNVSDAFVNLSKKQKEITDQSIFESQERGKTLSENLSDSENLKEKADSMPTNSAYQIGIAEQFKNGNFPQQGEFYDSPTASLTEANLYKSDGWYVQTGYRKPKTLFDSNGNPLPESQQIPATPQEVLFRSWVLIKSEGDKQTMSSNNATAFTPDRPYSQYISDVIKQQELNNFPGSYKFFIEKLHGRYSNGKSYKKNRIKKQKDSTTEIPIEYTNRMVFAAYINNYNDSFTVNKSDFDFLGKAEGTPVYKNTKRNMTLEFSIMADYSAELMTAASQLYKELGVTNGKVMDEQLDAIIKNKISAWTLGVLPKFLTVGANRVGGHIPGLFSDTPESLLMKMNFLAQCCYPYYRSDGKMKEQPMIRLRVADFYDVIGMITSLNINLDELEGIQIDMNKSNVGNVPLGVRVTMNIDIYHNYEVSSNFYGFYHRREFDEGTMDPVTGKGMPLSTMDSTAGNTKNTTGNTQIDKNRNREGTMDTPNVLNGVELQTIRGEVRGLTNSQIALENAKGRTIETIQLKKDAKESMQAYLRIQNIVNTLRQEQGLPSVAITNPTNFGSIDNVIKTGQNIIEQQFNTLKSVISDPIANNARDVASNINQLYGSAESISNEISQKISTLNQGLKSVGIGTDISDGINSIQQNIDKIKTSNMAPKTIGELLEQIKARNGSI